MFKYIAVMAFFLLTTSKALAALMYADDFLLDQDRKYLTRNSTSSWLANIEQVSSSPLVRLDIFPNIYSEFLNSYSEFADSYDEIPDSYDEIPWGERFRVDLENTGMLMKGSENNRVAYDGNHKSRLKSNVDSSGEKMLVGESTSGQKYALDATEVPEPSSLILFVIGLVCVIKVRRSVNSVNPVSA